MFEGGGKTTTKAIVMPKGTLPDIVHETLQKCRSKPGHTVKRHMCITLATEQRFCICFEIHKDVILVVKSTSQEVLKTTLKWQRDV